MSPFALQLENVVIHRNGRRVLDGVTLSVEPGSVVGLLGANGAGKTTLFDIACGLRRAEAGSVSSLGVRDRIAYLTQVVTIPDALRLGEMAQLVYGLSASDKTRVDALLAGLGQKLTDKFRMLWKRRANSCSYGEKRWFVLMVILSLDADLAILDEPTAGVDPEYRFYLWQAVAQMRSNGKAVLFSTHLVDEVQGQCDLFYFLHEGVARRFASAAELLKACEARSLDEAFVSYVTGERSSHADDVADSG